MTVDSRFLLPETVLHSAKADLTRLDIEILNGFQNRVVRIRINPEEDSEVKRLYEIWKSL